MDDVQIISSSSIKERKQVYEFETCFIFTFKKFHFCCCSGKPYLNPIHCLLFRNGPFAYSIKTERPNMLTIKYIYQTSSSSANVIVESWSNLKNGKIWKEVSSESKKFL